MSDFDISPLFWSQLSMFILTNQSLAFPHGLFVRPLTASPQQGSEIPTPKCVCSTQHLPRLLSLEWDPVLSIESVPILQGSTQGISSCVSFLVQTLQYGTWVRIQQKLYKDIGIGSSSLMWDVLSLGLHYCFPSYKYSSWWTLNLSHLHSHMECPFNLGNNFARSFRDTVMIAATLILFILYTGIIDIPLSHIHILPN